MGGYTGIFSSTILSWWFFVWWATYRRSPASNRYNRYKLLASFAYSFSFPIDTNRWQDGAIVANNPTIIAIREAQLLWPDIKIGCLISLGCGNLPTKVWLLKLVSFMNLIWMFMQWRFCQTSSIFLQPRGKGGWRYLDTGQVLIESACSVERVEVAVDTLLPMLPDIQYFRFNPGDSLHDI